MTSRLVDAVRRLLGSDVRRRLFAGAGWTAIGLIGSRGLAVAASFVMAHLLGAVGFGEFGMIMSTAAMVSAVAGAGIGITLTKHIAELRVSDPRRAGRVVGLGFLVSYLSAGLHGCALALFAPWLASETLSAPHLVGPLRVSAVFLAVGVVQGVQTAALDGSEAFRHKAIVGVVGGVLNAVGAVLGTWASGVVGAVIGMTTATAVSAGLAQFLLRREWARIGIVMDVRNAWREWAVLARFSLPTVLTQALSGPAYWAVNAMLANQRNGYAELGVLSAATQWQGAVGGLIGIATAGMVPVMMDRMRVDGAEAGARMTWKMIRALTVIVVPMVGFFFLVSPWIIGGYGAAFAGGNWTLRALVATGAIGAVIQPLSQFIASRDRMWWVFGGSCVWVVLTLAASALWVDRGAVGIAAARLLAQAVFAVVCVLIALQLRSPPKGKASNHATA